MSTKTTFKRIALVAVAALGLGVISVAPSSANVNSITFTVANGTAIDNDNYDSSTAATFSVKANIDGMFDSVTVTYSPNGRPSGATALTGLMRYIDSSVGFESTVDTNTSVGDTNLSVSAKNDSTTSTFFMYQKDSSTAGNPQANFRLELDSTTNIIAGTYTYSVTVKAFDRGVLVPALTQTKDVSIVVSAAPTAARAANAANSTAVLYAGTSFVANNTVDSAVSSVATASATEVATIRVALVNTAGGYARESITAVITGAGTIGNASIGGAAGTGVSGKSIVVAMTSSNYVDLDVYADGTAGVATINLSSTSVTFAPKTVTFYAKSPKTITAAAYNPVLNVGANATAIAATAVDANGTNWAGQLYVKAVAAADALVGGSATDPVACAYNASEKTHFCPVTTITAGTAKFVVVDESLDTDAVYAAADSAATSSEVSLTASSGVATTVKLAFDKATYAPFEKATITVTPLDAAGKTLGSKAITNLFATGGITANVAFGAASDTLTAVTLTTAAASGASTTAGAYTYTVYMPAQGDVTISATGGTGLAPAGQVKVTATASVVNSSVDAATDAANEATDAANAATDAALAAADAADAATAAAQDASDAVAALSASVSKLISSLRAQITSLTNLVIKIQKKVRA
jgi:trimeric autotransporter adhesin